MHFRPAIFTLLALFWFACGAGCQRSPAKPSVSKPTALSPETIASIHWMGKQHLGLEADAYYFSRIWSLPETARLESQTFDRLSFGTWRLLLGEQAAARIPVGVLRPLFEELAFQESYLEIRANTGAAPSVVLATYVGDRYAGIWETNSGVVAELLSSHPIVPAQTGYGWTLRQTNAPSLISLTRVGDWAMISAGPDKNSLSDEIAGRIRRDGVPFVSAGTNLWLEASLDRPRLATLFPALNSQFSTIQHVNFSLSGDGGNVITRARVNFAKPLPATLEPWHLPMDLLHEPLTSFTAVRGLQSWLAGWPVWRDVSIGPAPDQCFTWSLAGSPYQIYLAAPLPDARQQVASLSEHLMQKGNPWLAAHGYINFDRASDGNGVKWGNLPDIKPFIKFAGSDADGWLFAGLLPDTNSPTAPPPAGMIQDILSRTNLVYYNWEVTGPQIAPCLYLGQTVRQILRQPTLATGSASAAWLGVLMPRLGTSATIVNRTGPAELTLYRRSTFGLTAPELQLFTGWLESPQFPAGLPGSW